MFFWVIFSIIGAPISIYALDEPTSMRSDDGSLQDYYYLSEERQKLGYDGPPSNYETGVKLVRVDEMDKENGAYTLVFWHWVKINEKNDPTNFVHEKPSFHYVNADHVEIEEQHIEPHYFEQKLIGHFHGPMNFENFPFEQLILQIIIEPAIQQQDEPVEHDEPEHQDIELEHQDIELVNFVLDPKSTIDPQATVPGFSVGEFSLEKSEHVHEGIEQEVFSRVVFSFNVERSSYGSFLTSILPATMITGLALLTFYIPSNYTPRIYLTAPLLLALVYLHRTVLSEIPSVGYATFFDKMMVIDYSIFVIAITSLAIQMRYNTVHKNPENESKINKIMFLLIPVIVLIEIGLLWFS